MKKPYVKPQLYYENFELSQHVAACGWDMNAKTKEDCSAAGDPDFYNPPDVFLFIADNSQCNSTDNEAYCYEPSSESFRIFNS